MLGRMALLAATNSAAAGATDPHFANVSLLLHGDGTDGSTTIVDSSPSPKTVTAVNNARISTAQSKFGGSSIFFDGTGDRLTLAANISAFEFGTGDFTVEGWFWESSRTLYASALEIGNHLSSTGIIFLTSDSSTPASAGMYSGEFITSITNGSLSTWNHIAWVRKAGAFRTFVNGVSSTPVTPATKNLSDLTTITIGSLAAGSGNYDFNGYMDEFRVTKGVARYDANFSVPTAPFPDA